MSRSIKIIKVMNTENETGVKVPKGQINYNTVAGSLGLAAFAGLGLKNWLGGGSGAGAGLSGATGTGSGASMGGVSQTVLNNDSFGNMGTPILAGLMAELAKEKSERYADNIGISTFKEALALVQNEREARQANDKITFETLARFDKEIALNKQSVECLSKEVSREFCDVRQTLHDKIALEAERRKSADDQIFEYGNCNYVKYIKKIDASQICPVVELAARTAGPAVPDANATTPTQA